MPNNNPSGTNGWEGFGTEEPYGQATKDAALAGAAPLAGGKLAAGAIGAPKKAQKQATKQAASQAPASPESQAVPAAPQPQTVAETWAAIAASPGANQYPILQQLATEAAASGS